MGDWTGKRGWPGTTCRAVPSGEAELKGDSEEHLQKEWRGQGHGVPEPRECALSGRNGLA